LEDVYLMKSTVGDNVKVKAAGGVRTYEDAIRFLWAGADRIGTSGGHKLYKSPEATKVGY
jgi:deoxyribose-phosphate aldolase